VEEEEEEEALHSPNFIRWALCLPTFSHFLIVNKTSLSRALAPLILSCSDHAPLSLIFQFSMPPSSLLLLRSPSLSRPILQALQLSRHRLPFLRGGNSLKMRASCHLPTAVVMTKLGDSAPQVRNKQRSAIQSHTGDALGPPLWSIVITSLLPLYLLLTYSLTHSLPHFHGSHQAYHEPGQLNIHELWSSFVKREEPTVTRPQAKAQAVGEEEAACSTARDAQDFGWRIKDQGSGEQP
jgi:hypothetical protein